MAVIFLWWFIFFGAPPTGDPTGFVMRIGTNGNTETGWGILPLPEGGYLLSGGAGNGSYIQRWSENDEMIWQRNFDFTNKNDFIRRMQLDSEGYLLGAGRDRPDGGELNFYFRYDYINDQFLWARLANVPPFSRIEQLLEHPQTGHFLSIGVLHPGIAGADGWLMQFDRNSGAALDHEGLHLKNSEVFNDGLFLNNALYTLGCVRHGPALDHIRVALSSYDLNGNHQWTRSYLELPLESARTYGTSLVNRSDTLIFSTRGPLKGADLLESNACIISTDLNGQVYWAKTLDLDNSSGEYGLGFYKIPDGYLLVGTHHHSEFGENILVVRLDLQGEVVWARSIGGPGLERANYGAVIGDHFYVYGSTMDENEVDALLAKLPIDGSVNGFGCDWVFPLSGRSVSIADPIENLVNLSTYSPNNAMLLIDQESQEAPVPLPDPLCNPLLDGPWPQNEDCNFEAIVIPNLFSPNKDGRNDEFRALIPEGGLESVVRMEVYDRWGNQVYAATGADVGWTGIYNGYPVPADTYAYRLEIACREEVRQFFGEINLMR